MLAVDVRTALKKHRRVVAVCPTGSGKTVIALHGLPDIDSVIEELETIGTRNNRQPHALKRLQNTYVWGKKDKTSGRVKNRDRDFVISLVREKILKEHYE